MKTLFNVSRTAFLEVWSNQRSFWTQVVIILVNDAVFIAFWHLFFGKVQTLQGWQLEDALLLLAVNTAVFGLATGLCANAQRLGEMTATGQLDPALTLPVDPLRYSLFRRISTASLGDLLFGVGLFAFVGSPTLGRTALFGLVVVLGSVVLVSFLVLIGSLTLFFGGKGEQGEAGLFSMIMLGFFPIDLFGGVTKLLMFTVLPAGFVTAVPVGLLRDFNPFALLALAIAAAFLALLSRATFNAGLRRYRSGSTWVKA